MKVLVLNYEYPPVGGGGGRLCAKLCESLAGRGHEIRVVTAGLRHLPEREEQGGVQIFRPRSFRRREDTCSVPEMALYLITALPTALRLARTWKPDVLHAHFVAPSGFLAPLTARMGRIPYVVTAHLGDVPGGVPEQTAGLFRVASPVAGWVWRHAAEVTAVSSFVGGLTHAAWGRAPRVILNGIPAIPPPEITLSPDGLRLLFVGRLSIQKDPLLAVQSLARIADHRWTLDVIGEGPLGAEMRAAASGLEGRIRWRGWLPEEGVRALMARADALLMTSRQEGLPMAAVEALWHGLAIVGSNIGGLADVILPNQNGFLCERTPASFADALARLANNPGQLASMRQASLGLAGRFDFQETVSAYERVLGQAVSAKKHPGK